MTSAVMKAPSAKRSFREQMHQARERAILQTACDLLGAKFTGEQARRVRAHPKLFVPDFTTHLMMSEKLPASAKRMEAFNRGLKALRQSGEYGKILQQQPCAADLAQALQGG